MRHKYITVSFYEQPKFSFLGVDLGYDPNYEAFERLLLKHIFARALSFVFKNRMSKEDMVQRVQQIIDNCNCGIYNKGTERHITFFMNPDFDMDLIPFRKEDVVDCELGLFRIGDTFRDVDEEVENSRASLNAKKEKI